MSDSQEKIPVEASRASEPTGESFTPAVDVFENEQQTILLAEMPGVPRDAIRVEVDKGVLTISGQTSWAEPSESDFGRTYVELQPGQFYRAFALSDEVDRTKITASMTGGVLKLTLPKAEASRTRRIEIQTD